ncbi:hypothetical protein [Gymnodinialimonas mytili]
MDHIRAGCARLGASASVAMVMIVAHVAVAVFLGMLVVHFSLHQ